MRGAPRIVHMQGMCKYDDMVVASGWLRPRCSLDTMHWWRRQQPQTLPRGYIRCGDRCARRGMEVILRPTCTAYGGHSVLLCHRKGVPSELLVIRTIKRSPELQQQQLTMHALGVARASIGTRVVRRSGHTSIAVRADVKVTGEYNEDDGKVTVPSSTEKKEAKQNADGTYYIDDLDVCA